LTIVPSFKYLKTSLAVALKLLVEDKKYFVDEQRFGPYAMWHHQHHFKQVPEGIEMTDIVHYKLPLGFLGDIAHSLFVKNQLKGIFDHRFKVVEEMFNKG
jgi:ligand-binding SRPBCC domain-containing protein